MTYRSTSIEVRPDTSVDFFENSDDHKAYIAETYLDTSKSNQVTSVRSGDDLTRTRVRDFDNKDSFDEMKADEKYIAVKELRVAYNTENSISKEGSHGEV
jgi:hypothetical protein